MFVVWSAILRVRETTLKYTAHAQLMTSIVIHEPCLPTSSETSYITHVSLSAT